MELEITDRKENALLGREELTVDIDHAGEPTPAENAVRKRLAAEHDFDPLTIRIDHIHSSQGLSRSTATVKVFDEPIMDELPSESETDDAEEEAAEEEEAAADEAEDSAGEAEDTTVDESEADEEEPSDADTTEDENGEAESADEDDEDEDAGDEETGEA